MAQIAANLYVGDAGEADARVFQAGAHEVAQFSRE
jgi:hypothetical protein